MFQGYLEDEYGPKPIDHDRKRSSSAKQRRTLSGRSNRSMAIRSPSADLVLFHFKWTFSIICIVNEIH